MGLQDIVLVAEARVGHSIGKPLHTDPVKGIFGITNIFAILLFYMVISKNTDTTITVSVASASSPNFNKFDVLTCATLWGSRMLYRLQKSG
jgi:hypothetical protein